MNNHNELESTNHATVANPMVYDRSDRALCAFQRWVIKRFHQFVLWRQCSGNPDRDTAPDPPPVPMQLTLPSAPGQ